MEHPAPVQNKYPAYFKITALLWGVMILGLGSGLQNTLVGVRASLEGMSDKDIGFLMSMYFVGYAVCSVVVPRLVQAVGHVRTFAALASIASAAALGHVLIISPLTWASFRVVTGGCYAGLLLIVESWLNSSTDRSHRGKVLSIYGIVLLFSFAVSQSFLNLAPLSGFHLFCVVSIFFSLALVPITLSRATVPGSVSTSRMGIRRLYEVSPVSFLGVFFVGMWLSGFLAMGPIFATKIGFGKEEISIFMGISMVGAVILQWPLGWYSDRMDRRLMIAWLTGAIGVISALMALFSEADSLLLLAALSFLFGGAAVPIYSISIANTNDQISEGETVAAASTLILIFALGSSISPFLASTAMDRSGPKGLFIFFGLGSLLFLGFLLYQVPRKEAILESPKEKFLVIPHTTHVVLQLHHHPGPKDAENIPEKPEEPPTET